MRIALALVTVSLLPGIPLAALFARRLREAAWFCSTAVALGILWSVLVTFVAALAHLPFTVPALFVLHALPLVVVVSFPALRRAFTQTMRSRTAHPATTTVIAVTTVLLAVPLLTVQRQLPTGDVQKAIFWAERTLATNALPDYREALGLNRDPTDFSIPGLHTLTAAVITLAGEPLRSVAWFSLLAGIALPGLAGTIGRVVAAERPLVAPFAFLLAATNIRLLRYTAAPGYHYQNLIGELLLVTAVLLVLLALSGRGGQRPVLAAAVSVLVLPLVHQFTAFLAAFVVPIVLGFLVIRYRSEIGSLYAQFPRRKQLAVGFLGMLALAGIAVSLIGDPLRDKLPQLFTVTPHLRPYVIPLVSYPNLLGVPFTLLALAGLTLVLVRIRWREIDWRWGLVLLWALLLLTLSQGARWVIDIPSARVTFYLAVPMALLGAGAVASATERVRAWWPRASAFLVPTALALTLAPTAGASLNDTLQKIDHSLQANATLTPGIRELMEFLNDHPPACGESWKRGGAPCANGILIDDWNRRRLTWTILTPYRMLTRVGADLAVIAREAEQSPQRRAQYQALLDFEKIFALGNGPEILPLLDRYKIAAIATANGASADVFAHNQGLTPMFRNGEVTLYAVNQAQETGNREPDGGTAERIFLLDPTTLANDIGDSEDVFAHLPVSLLAPRISDPELVDGHTVRDIQSSVSAIGLNVGAYLPERWNANSDRVVDAPITVLLRVLGNGARGRITRGTTVFEKFSLPNDGALHTLRVTVPAGELPIDEQGLAFLTVRLDQGPLRVDLVAAGPSPIP